MEIIKTLTELHDCLVTIRSAKQKIALVPTMGALHLGHISLIERAKTQAEVIICSIFVNPTQFTDPKDLEKYPRPIEHDLAMLEAAGCSIVFMPKVSEMYPKPEAWHIDLGAAEFLLEGAFRKGHYQGVTQIVKKLFDATQPDIALFGQKDYQQVLMIKNMVKHFNLPIEIVTCPIIRESDGLALSSRNIHLSPEDHQHALILSKALFYIDENLHNASLEALVQKASTMILQEDHIELDYLIIANGNTLEPAKTKTEKPLVALVAAKVGATRLIDNVILS